MSWVRSVWVLLVVAAAAALGAAVTMSHTGPAPGGSSAPAPDQQPTKMAGRVVVVAEVVDGDTLRVDTRTGRGLGRVRLLDVDAPELAHDGRPAQCYAGRARHALARLARPGSRVRLLRDRTQPDRDVYGRLLRYVMARGVDVGRRLLAAGAVRRYRAWTPISRARGYAAAATRAREAGRGLWRAC